MEALFPQYTASLYFTAIDVCTYSNFVCRFQHIEEYLTSIGLQEYPVPGDGHCMLTSVSKVFGVDKKMLIDVIADEAVERREFYQQFTTSPSKMLDEMEALVKSGLYDQETIDLVINMIANALQVQIHIVEEITIHHSSEVSTL